MFSELDYKALFPTGQRQTNTDPAYDLDDPAKPDEVPVLDGDSPAEGCGVTSDRQRCSCRRICVQVVRNKPHGADYYTASLLAVRAGATNWLERSMFYR